MKFKSISIALLITAGLAACTNTPKGPDSSEIKSWEQQAANVEIIRDNWGVPHVYGNTDADAVFGLIYAECEDDYQGVEEYFIGRLGRRSLYHGEKHLVRDLYDKLFMDSTKAIDAYNKMEPYYQHLLQAHAAGLNYYIYKHPEKKRFINRYEPWMQLMGSGPMGAGPFWTGLGLSNENVTAYLQSRTTDSISTPGISYVPSMQAYTQQMEATGSNAWVLGPGRTTSGHAFMLINPHASISVESLRFEVHAASKEGLNVYGSPFVGDMIIWNGFNEHIGWAHTAQYSDQADVYKIKFDDPTDSLSYRYGNTHRRATIKKVSVKYTSGNSIKEKDFNILVTAFGPIVGTVDGVPVAIKDTQNIITYFKENWDIGKIKNYEAFYKNLSLTSEKPNTFAYADDKGNIAFWHSNVVPRRNPKYDWSKPIEDAGPDTEWKGLHSVEEIPHVINPASGFAQNCNSNPWILSGKSSPDSSAFPAYMSYDPRSLRSILGDRIFNNNRKFSRDDFEAAALRNYYLVRFELLLPSLFKMYDASKNTALKNDLEAPVEVLRKWNYVADTNSIATTLSVLLEEKLSHVYEKTVKPFAISRERYAYEYTKAGDFKGDTALLLLKGVVDTLQKDFGTWQVAWGSINRLQRVSPNTKYDHFDDNRHSEAVAAAPNPAGCIFDYQSHPAPGTKLRYGTKGNTFVAVIDFGEKVHARTVLANGQSADPASPHFEDQSHIYATGQLKDALFYKEDVMKHVEKQYHPGEE